MNKLTFDDGHRKIELSLGFYPGVQRTPGDVALSCYAHCSLPVRCTVLIAADGTFREWIAEFEHEEDCNTYWHFSHGSDEWAQGNPVFHWEPHKPTEAQIKTIARIWLNIEKPFGLTNGVGQPVASWAFYQLPNAQEISNRYGDGKMVYRA